MNNLFVLCIRKIVCYIGFKCNKVIVLCGVTSRRVLCVCVPVIDHILHWQRAWRIFLLAKRYAGDDLRHTVQIGVELKAAVGVERVAKLYEAVKEFYYTILDHVY